MTQYILYTLVRVSFSSHSLLQVCLIHMCTILYIIPPISSVICLLLDNYSHGPECKNIFMQDDIPFFINTKHSYILCTSLIIFIFVLKLGHKSFTFVDIFSLHTFTVPTYRAPFVIPVPCFLVLLLSALQWHLQPATEVAVEYYENVNSVQRIYFADCLTSLIYEIFSQLYRQ